MVAYSETKEELAVYATSVCIRSCFFVCAFDIPRGNARPIFDAVLTNPTLLNYKLASEVDLTFDCMASRQIARKEVEVDDVVTQARQGSDRRVLATRGRCAAENELEEALLELTVINYECRQGQHR